MDPNITPPAKSTPPEMFAGIFQGGAGVLQGPDPALLTDPTKVGVLCTGARNHWDPAQTPAAQKSTFKAQTAYSDTYLLE